MSETAAKRLAAIHKALVEAGGDGAALERVSVEDLVEALIQAAAQGHRATVMNGKIRRLVVECLDLEDDHRSTYTLVKCCVEKACAGASGAIAPEALDAVKRALRAGKVNLSAGALAGVREMLTGESGAVEVSLTEQEVVDLALSGVAFTEVGDGKGGDALVKLVDTTGQLKLLAERWTGKKGKQRTEGTSH